MIALRACGGLVRRLSIGSLVLAAALVSHPAIAADPVGAAAESQVKSSVGEPISVHLDQAKVLRVPDRTATLVVGNPLIADVTVQPGGIMVLTAKSYGVTNVVALDRNGVTLMEHPVQVLGPIDSVVVMYRGVERETYSCMPHCERRITLGDSAAYFAGILGQSGVMASQAQGSGQQQQQR